MEVAPRIVPILADPSFQLSDIHPPTTRLLHQAVIYMLSNTRDAQSEGF